MDEHTEKEEPWTLETDKVIRAAQAVILVYSTIVAVEGLCIYVKKFSMWAERKFEKTNDNLLTIVPDEDN